MIPQQRRVFITAVGAVLPFGREPEEMFDRIYQGESAIRWGRTGTEDFGSNVLLARVERDVDKLIPPRQRVLMARVSKLAMIAAQDALQRAGLDRGDPCLREAGVYMGCGLGGTEVIQDGFRKYYVKKSRRMRPTSVPLIMVNAPASHITMAFDIQGPATSYSVACSSSAVSIGEAFRAIRDGYLGLALAGGAEAMLNDGVVASWERLGVLATLHPDGDKASCRPFDEARSGMVLGEGAVVLLLESEESMAARGSTPVAEIIGFGTSSDAKALTEPNADGQARAITAALMDADVSPDEIGYINAHATATVTGDPVEIQAIKQAFGAHASRVAISSTKSMHGHLIGAAGAVETAITALSLSRRRIPPTANLTNPDPMCDLDCVPVRGRPAPDLDVAMSNSFAFGGSNATLVLKRV
ncbi:MAG: beta-ketoacyl-[acyl-carrier-protein] synthase family protein [Longimicrobiales bacterium]